MLSERERDLASIRKMPRKDFRMRMDLLRAMVAADPELKNYSTRWAYDELVSLDELAGDRLERETCRDCGRIHRAGTNPIERHRA